VLGSWFLDKTAEAVDAALTDAGAGAPVAVVDHARLGQMLAERGRAVLQLAARPRSLRRLEGGRVYAAAGALPLAEAALGALIAVGVGELDDWQPRITEWSRAVRAGGVLVLIDRGPAAELTRRALCAGLADIRQRTAGRSFITTGAVVAIDGYPPGVVSGGTGNG
jgi:hypothetical protein